MLNIYTLSTWALFSVSVTARVSRYTGHPGPGNYI